MERNFDMKFFEAHKNAIVNLVEVQNKILKCMEQIDRDLVEIKETYLAYFEGFQKEMSKINSKG